MNKRDYVRERERRRVRRWDWVAVAVALLLFLGAAGFYLYTKRAPVEEVNVTCTLLISEAEGDLWVEDDLPVCAGDLLRCQNGTVVMGEIEAVTVKPHLYATVIDGNPLWEEHPHLVDVEVTVRMQARGKAGDGLRVGDLRVASGGTGEYRFGRYLSRGEILEVSVEA